MTRAMPLQRAVLATAVLAIWWTGKAAANSLWIPVKVNDCKGPISSATVAIIGCVDGFKSNYAAPSVNDTSVYGIVTNGVLTKTYVYDSSKSMYKESIPDLTSGACSGLHTEYCFGSADNKCKILVVKGDTLIPDDTTYVPKFVIDTTYEAETLFTNAANSPVGLKEYVLKTLNAPPCSSPDQYCYTPTVAFSPRKCNTCPTCNAKITPPPYPIQPVNAAGETAYGVLCDIIDDFSKPTTYPAGKPFSVSFRSDQKVFGSAVPVDVTGNKWGWEILWPRSIIPSAAATSPCSITGTLYAGQDIPVGSVTATVAETDTSYVLVFTYDVSASKNSIKEAHIYFSGSAMTTSAPGQYGSASFVTASGSRVVGQKVLPKDGCKGDFLYLSFHSALGASAAY